MTEVETVRGPVPAESLQSVLMHEHVFVRLAREVRSDRLLGRREQGDDLPRSLGR
jgi:predicted metal-dependent phosphotriesterase family hydrolase